MAKKFFLMMTVLAAVLLTACRTSDGLTKAEREAAVTRQVQEGLDTRHYTIAVDWMKPLGGMARHVTSNYELKVNGVHVNTPPKEMELIFHLAKNPNRVFTRDQLLDEVWGFDYYGDSRTVDVHIKRLREKLAGVSDKWELRTVWGVGYRFETKD